LAQSFQFSRATLAASRLAGRKRRAYAEGVRHGYGGESRGPMQAGPHSASRLTGRLRPWLHGRRWFAGQHFGTNAGACQFI